MSINELLVAYCPSCSHQLGAGSKFYSDVVGNAQTHASVTGHFVQIVQQDTWTTIETVAGEPALPLWN